MNFYEMNIVTTYIQINNILENTLTDINQSFFSSSRKFDITTTVLETPLLDEGRGFPLNDRQKDGQNVGHHSEKQCWVL